MKKAFLLFQTLIALPQRVSVWNLVGVVAAVRRRRRCCVLDVGDGYHRLVYRVYRSYARTAFHKEEDPLYGGYRGGPAYYIHDLVEDHLKKKTIRSAGCSVCHCRSDLLRYQSGNQQLRGFFFKNAFYSAALQPVSCW